MMNSRTFRAAVALTVVASLATFAPAGARAEVAVKDAGGHDMKVADTSRVVAIGGDVTEIIYALKAEAKIAAVDSTSQFPAEALKDKKNVGYMRALSAEGVLSANPTVILASKDAGPPDVVAALKASAIPYVEVPDDHTPEGAVAKIRFIAKLVGAESAGDALAKSVEQDFATLAHDRAKIARPVRAIFVLTVQNGRATVAGTNTSADAVIKLAGAENAAAAVEGYKPLVEESAMQLAPDAIVTMRHSSSTFKSDDILAVKGLQASPAGQNKRVIEMDGLYLLSFGPRSARAARDLMAALYPNLAERRAGE
jgi:iron complex transport system substrate-binding protein